MSTRKGTVVFLEDILEESTEVMHSVMKGNEARYATLKDPKATAGALALSAIVVQDFSAKRIKDYEFQWSRMTSFEGDTGPYLQYTHTRLCSIEKKINDLNMENFSLEEPDYSLLKEPAAQSLVLYLLKFPQVIVDACRTEEPCLLVTYLMTLCHQISSLIEHLYVLNQPIEIQKARLGLYRAAKVVLGNGIEILGLVPLSEM